MIPVNASFASRATSSNRMVTSLGDIPRKAPIYITIGPQCAGKTTLLSQLQQRMSKDPSAAPIRDITMDDQPGVYIPVDVRYFLDQANTNDHFLNRRMIGKTIGSRIRDQMELCSVLQRISGRLTAEEFALTIMNLYRNHTVEALTCQDENLTITEDMMQQDYHTHVAQVFIPVVEEFCGRRLPKTVDLFLLEALFRPHPKTNLTAVEAASQQLQRLSKTTALPIAWGNTNTRPREYKNALDAAVQSNRQVYFIVYGDGSRISGGAFLPVIDFAQLLRRNIKRLLENGKFVPAKGIWESSQRVDNLLQMVLQDLDKGAFNESNDDGDLPIHTKLEFDKTLCRLANFEMDDNRYVKYVPPPTRRKRSQSPETRRRGAGEENQNSSWKR